MDDDNTRTHLVWISNSIYVPNLQMTLLSPKHWVQQVATSHPWSSEGMVCYTMAETTVLEWDQCKFRKTIQHSQATNTPTFFTSPGANLCESFCSKFEALQAQVAPLGDHIPGDGYTTPSVQEVGRLEIHCYGTMDDGKMRLEQQAASPADDPPLKDNKIAIASNKSCAKWTDPNDPCPWHPDSCYK